MLFTTAAIMIASGLVLQVPMLAKIRNFRFHDIPKYARSGSRLAMEYLVLVWGGFILAGIDFHSKLRAANSGKYWLNLISPVDSRHSRNFDG